MPSRRARNLLRPRGELPSVPSVLGFQNHHFNAVVSWAVDAKGEVTHAYA